uniref:Endonuclease V n=1 Tax=Arcella intermedia TaxID=1963864 RepID=A0A6B2LJ46_9EUKA
MDYKDEEVRKAWELEQIELKKQLVTTNLFDWNLDDGSLKYVAGVDISFVKGNEVDACACLIILTWPELKVVHSSFEMVQLTLPYIPGFLAFREVNFLVKLLDKLKAEKPEIYPQLVFVDGNGYLHPRGFGLACHLGVLTGLPCIGVGKTLMYVDGLEIKGVKQKFKKECLKPGDYSLLVGESSQVWGAVSPIPSTPHHSPFSPPPSP